ncbi:MAG: urea transporter [Candidatus Latescibacteria bacterium]|nr:urea transporter [Candidatus Latescibacterota bacterium]
MIANNQSVNGPTKFINSILNSYATIFFANNRWLGLVLLLATFNTPFIGFAGLIGVIISIITARALKITTDDDQSGYYSFNSLLVSLAAAFFFPGRGFDISYLFLIIVFASIFTTILSNALAKYFQYHLYLPALSLAFVVMTFLILLVYNRLTGRPLLIQFPRPLLVWSVNLPDWTSYYFKSIGSILFQPSLVGGIIIALVLFVHSRISFVLSVIGFIIGYLVINATGSFSEMEIMLSGFTTLLTAVAIGGVYFIPSISSFLVAVIASVVGILSGIGIQSALLPYGIPALAIPFNLTVLVVLYAFKTRLKNSSPYLVDFYTGSPEQNLEYYNSRIVRFIGKGQAQFYLPFNGEWTITQAPNQEPTHKLAWQNAWDFEVLDEQAQKFTNLGNDLKDYYCFGAPVLAPANGTVVKVVSWVKDNSIGQINTRDNWGNLVVIYHAPGIYSLLAHLKYNSIQVSENQMVKAGDVVGLCGNSGRSFVPHLHFHIQTALEPGSPTIKIDLLNYILKNTRPNQLIKFGSPQKGERIVALKSDARLQETLKFSLGDELTFKNVLANGTTFEEHIKTDIDFWGNLYLKSDRKARAWFSIYNGFLHILKFEGNTDSALYALTLALPSFAHTEHNELTWSDQPPISTVLPVLIRTIQDIFSFIARPLNFSAQYQTNTDQDGSVMIRGNVNMTMAKIRIAQWATACNFHPEKGITKIELNHQGKTSTYLPVL